MLIRRMTMEDYDSVYALWLSVPGMGLNTVDDSREGIEKYLLRNPKTCFVAVEEGALIGAILSGHDGRRAFISHTAVSPTHQRKGVGGALVRAALDALRAEGVTKAALVVFARNEKGNSFWEKQGFTLRTDINYRNRQLSDV
ncbi:MAG: GNAT family N-acetyltransferase [Eubacteriales bacterium]|nr:GNAT family N-acetyltransferase [Eubacteriales bacterium]